MIKFLHYINSFPIPFTSLHYQVFGEEMSARFKDNVLDSPEAWDLLREEHPHFSVSPNREEWLRAAEVVEKKDGQDGGLIRRAKEVASVLKEKSITSLFSVGVGGAGLEYQIKKILPDIHLTCSEYAPKNIEMLEKVFYECDEFLVFDIKKDDWHIALRGVSPDVQMCMLYRVDVHFTDKEWRAIFERMHETGIKQIFFIPSVCITIRSWAYRMVRRLRWFLRGEKQTFVGYVRTQKRFETFWSGLYSCEMKKTPALHGFVLTRM